MTNTYGAARARAIVAAMLLVVVLLIAWGAQRLQSSAASPTPTATVVERPVSREAVESYVVAWCRDNVPVELLASADEAAAACRRNLMQRYDVAKELERSAREMKK